MKFGVFMPPYHNRWGNPTRAFERDLEVAEQLDRLGFDELWIGEHHSSGFETIASPELFIAAVAGRTRTIRLGTGVISLPYHHPFNVAQRMVLLDHLTRGRVMMGVGPGALVADAYMRGIDPRDQRRRMAESLEAIHALLTSEEPISRKTDWFELREAHLQVPAYTKPHFELAVAAVISPSGPKLAGQYGASLLSVGATETEAYKALSVHWKVYDEVTKQHGFKADRSTWRLVGPMHIAESREQAMKDIEYGLGQYIDYFLKAANLPLAPKKDSVREAAEYMVEVGAAAIGTPDDAVVQINRLREASDGGFGTYLLTAAGWANHEATLRSYQLFADEVMPVFQQENWMGRKKSYEWAIERKPAFQPQAMQAIVKATSDYFGAEHERTRTVRGDEPVPPKDAKSG
jgi:limonene 1,2-monooxygenase